MKYELEVISRAFGRYVIRALGVLIMILVINACNNTSRQSEVDLLAGEWYMKEMIDTEVTKSVLENMAFSKEEISIIDEVPCMIKIAEFTQSGGYRFYYDVDASKEQIRTYFENVINTLYDRREELKSVYGDTGDITLEEFKNLYAQVFGLNEIEELIDLMMENSFDYEVIRDIEEHGSFTVKNGTILCKESGKSDSEKLRYVINGSSLKLIYGNGEEIYTKVNDKE